MREVTLVDEMPTAGPDFSGLQLRAEFESAVSLTADVTYWIVLSAPTSVASRTIVMWMPNFGAEVGTGMTECHARNATTLRQQLQFVQTGQAGCYLGVGQWHPLNPRNAYEAGSAAFRVTSP